MATLIHSGTVVAYRDGGHVILSDAEVAYDGNHITHVGHNYAGPVDLRIDARGKLVMPGMINHHMAFGIHMQLFRLDAARANFFNSGLGFGVQSEKAYHGAGPRPEHRPAAP